MKLSLQEGQNGRKRFTLGIAIQSQFITDCRHARIGYVLARGNHRVLLSDLLHLAESMLIPQAAAVWVIALRHFTEVALGVLIVTAGLACVVEAPSIEP